MSLISTSLHLSCKLLQLLFSTFTASSIIFLIFFSILLLLEYIKLDNSFCYQVLIEVCLILIIFIFNILLLFVCIMYFRRIYREKMIEGKVFNIFLRFGENCDVSKDYPASKSSTIL